MSGRILVCVDSSEEAGAAIRTAAALFAGHEAVVACFWQPFADVARRFARSLLEIVQDADTVNQRERELAEQTAIEGAALAAASGLPATAEAVRVARPLDEAIDALAGEIDAAAIVLGTRGHGALRSLLAGNVVVDLLQRTARPVVVVPLPEPAGPFRPAGEDGDKTQSLSGA
jgi:nucleotide-binding universal stress UspA family protein